MSLVRVCLFVAQATARNFYAWHALCSPKHRTYDNGVSVSVLVVRCRIRYEMRKDESQHVVIHEASINQSNFYSANIPGSEVRHPNLCSTAKSIKQFHNVNRSLGMTVSMGEEARSSRCICLETFPEGGN